MTHHDWQKALSMWNEGIDTYSIAGFFGVHESIIYNGLSKVRGGHVLDGRLDKYAQLRHLISNDTNH